VCLLEHVGQHHQVEHDQDEQLHLQLEDWDAAPPALDGFWNGDMEMTFGLERLVEAILIFYASPVSSSSSSSTCLSL